MSRSQTYFLSKRGDKLKLSRSHIEELYRAAIPSLGRGSGKEVKGLCPFHDDSHPSLSVNLEKGVWICFAGCGGGNIFQFIARLEGVKIKDVDEILERRLR